MADPDVNAPAAPVVLCFGDSLTSGYHSYGREHSPYADELRRLLVEEGGLPEAVRVIPAGLDGEGTGTMHMRMRGTAREVRPAVVVILAGTNDLDDARPAEVVRNLERLHDLAREAGARTVAVTLPEMDAETAFPHIASTRRAVNDAVLARLGGRADAVADVCAGVPFHSLGEDERRLVWDDGLHCTPEGYRRVAHVLFPAVLTALRL